MKLGDLRPCKNEHWFFPLSNTWFWLCNIIFLLIMIYFPFNILIYCLHVRLVSSVPSLWIILIGFSCSILYPSYVHLSRNHQVLCGPYWIQDPWSHIFDLLYKNWNASSLPDFLLGNLPYLQDFVSLYEKDLKITYIQEKLPLSHQESDQVIH